MRMLIWSLAPLSGWRIWYCHELWCRSQIQLGFCVAVAMVWAGSYSSNSTPSLGTSICHGCSPKNTKKKKKKRHKKDQKTYENILNSTGKSNTVILLYTYQESYSEKTVDSKNWHEWGVLLVGKYYSATMGNTVWQHVRTLSLCITCGPAAPLLGIEPASSWMLVRFVNHWATMGTPRLGLPIQEYTMSPLL